MGTWPEPIIQKGLEDESGGDLIDDGRMLLAGMASLIENSVGFFRGQTFIPEMDGQASQLAKLSGEGLDFRGPSALIA